MPEATHPKRTVRRCECKYQAEKAWGYNVQQWVGGRRSWKDKGNAKTPEATEQLAGKFKTVLIRCNGCGACSSGRRRGWSGAASARRSAVALEASFEFATIGAVASTALVIGSST